MAITCTASVEDVIHARLDAEPGDMLERRVLADWLDEQGRTDEAAYQRWAVREGKWPVYVQPDATIEQVPWKNKWHWFILGLESYVNTAWDPYYLTSARLPKPIFNRLREMHAAYATRRGAETDLMRVLFDEGILQRGN